ncbi:MAG: hypothetical protein V3S46_00115 [Nitrospinota bacterium]
MRVYYEFVFHADILFHFYAFSAFEAYKDAFIIIHKKAIGDISGRKHEIESGVSAGAQTISIPFVVGAGYRFSVEFTFE